MREGPPAELVELLERLHLATAAQVRGMSGRVRRLARDLPRFASVWVDALAQAGVLTPFQAAEINAGRGEQLAVGPYVIRTRRESFGYGTCYEAVERETQKLVRLSVIPRRALVAEEMDLEQAMARLVEPPVPDELSESPGDASAPPINALRIETWGRDGDRLWTASPTCTARTAADWLIHYGRMSPELVLEIARQMAATLAALETEGLRHGDLTAARLLLARDGRAMLADPGLRPILRPTEGYSHADLPPEAFDGLAPERVETGSAPTAASELYACGCLWWQLLAGRTPLGGGNTQAKLRAVQASKIPDIARLAPDAPAVLIEVIRDCLQRDPAVRPQSFDKLAERLGPANPRTARQLARVVRGRPTAPVNAGRAPSEKRGIPRWVPVSAAALIMLAAARPWWPTMIDSLTGRDASAAARVTRDEQRPPVPPLPPLPKQDPTPQRSTPQVVIVPKTTLSAPQPNAPRPQLPRYLQRGPRGELLINAAQPVRIESLPLSAGQTVRSTPGRRAQVWLPDEGLTIAADDVKFENIDFVWQREKSRQLDRVRPAAMFRLAAERCQFRECSFQVLAGEQTPVVLWTGPAERPAADVTLATGQLLLSDCVIRGGGAAIDARWDAALVVEAASCLLLETGPLLQLQHGPSADQPVVVGLSRTTLRQTGGIVRCGYQELPDNLGRITVEATDCALDLALEQALVTFDGPDNPQPLLAGFEWTGQGSVVSPAAALVVWRDEVGGLHAAREEQVRAEGLLRGELGFAGDDLAQPADSRITRWQAPRRSPDPPGAADARLHLPAVRAPR